MAGGEWGKRTVISRVIAPPDMTGTRERRHQLWLSRDENLSGRRGGTLPSSRGTGRLANCNFADKWRQTG